MKSLYAAMAKAFAEIEGAAKDRVNPAFKSKYADLASVVEAIKPAFAHHGLFFAQVTHEVSGGVCVETLIGHESGEEKSFGKLFVPATKQDAQGYGSALTYARRYSLMAACGVAPEDDDGNAAAASAPRQPAKPAIISEAQYAEIGTLVQASGVDLVKMLNHYGAPTLRELPASSYDHATAMLVKKINDAAEQKKAA